ncbi:hypothetical protein EDB19DRAFT_1643521, partial [Suillus lakei]
NSNDYRMKAKHDSASLKVTAALWPAYLYPGNIAGKDFDPEDIIEGLFHGYLWERVTKHIFTSPSSALKAGVSNGTHTCNAKLHGMTEVGAEHIAYVTVHVCFAISSLEKWKDQDDLFYYTDFYTRIVNLIWGRKDGEWVYSLLRHYNEQVIIYTIFLSNMFMDLGNCLAMQTVPDPVILQTPSVLRTTI